MKLLKQKTLRDSNEIFNELTTILSNSKSKIQVASAWFTDPDLFNLLLQRQKSGIDVSLVISDQKQNNKLPFEKLIQYGGEVRRIKKTGYGMMHQKFCIIDDEILVHGSYNWTINARKNNDESVIITNHQQTISEMSEVFNQLRENSKVEGGHEGNLIKKFFSKLWNRTKGNPENELQPQVNTEESDNRVHVFSSKNNGYKDVLDNLMDSEIANFDKEKLQDYGFEMALSSSGNSEMLKNHLDAVYADFLLDISLGEDELKSLKSKIEIVRSNAIAQKERYRNIHKGYIDKIYENKLNERLNELDRINKELETKLSECESIETKKGLFNQKIDEIKENLSELNLNYNPLKIKKYELYSFGLMSLISLVAIIIFYGSALYIMRYGYEDAIMALDNGIILRPPGIFDDQAFSKALDKGKISFILLCIFFIVPVGLAIYRLYTKINGSKISSLIALLAILCVDGFIAARISMNVHEVEYLQGNVTEPWKVSNILTDLDFYSVFIIGGLVVLLFEFFAGKVKAYHDNKNGDVDAQKLRLEKNQCKVKMDEFIGELNKLDQNKITIQSDMNQLKIEIKGIQRSIDQIPNEQERELNHLEENVNNELNEIDENCDLVLNSLESGLMPFSFDVLKERVSIFLVGWSDFLHKQFSIKVANDLTDKMNVEKEEWISEKSESNIMKRVA